MNNEEKILEMLSQMQSNMDAHFEQIDTRLDRMDSSFGQIDSSFGQIDSSFKQIDSRFEQIDSRFEQIDSRFEQMDSRFDNIENEVHKTNMKIELVIEPKIGLLLDGVTMNSDAIERVRKQVDKLANVQEHHDVALRALGQ